MNKNTIIGIIILIVILFMATAVFVGVVKVKQNREIQKIQNQLNDYRNAVTEYKYVIIESLYNLEVVGNLEVSYWYQYINNNKYSSPDDAIDKALNDKSEEIKLIKSNRWKIDSKYVNTQNPPDVDNDTVRQLKVKCEELYNSYYDFYHCILSPRGNYSEFTEEFTKLDREGGKISREIDVLISVVLQQSLALNNK